jgi:hypothetical protein
MYFNICIYVSTAIGTETTVQISFPDEGSASSSTNFNVIGNYILDSNGILVQLPSDSNEEGLDS